MRSAVACLAGLAAANLAAWLWAWAAFADRPALWGSALLAWLFGLRHAADADHLAAIDNVVRKLVQDGRKSRLVGLWFSLGHATVVIAAAAVIAATASDAPVDQIAPVGSVVGTAVSAGFLLVIALVNLRTLLGLLRGDRDAGPQGLLGRVLGPAVRAIRRPWHMYPLGFLFGLGFDTATEVGLLALAATQAASGVSFLQVLVFPALFTAGMALVDTADSVVMTSAYAWALADPARKRTYNVTVTLLSVVLALMIGGLEAAGMLIDQLGLQGAVWDALADPPIADLGFVIVALFALTWGWFALRYRRAGRGQG